MIEAQPLAIAIVVCASLTVALAMVLNHLAAMRVKTSEVAALQEIIARALAERDLMLNDLRRDLNNETAKLTQLSNRVR